MFIDMFSKKTNSLSSTHFITSKYRNMLMEHEK